MVVIKRFRTKKSAKQAVKRASMLLGNLYTIRKTKKGYTVYRYKQIK